MVEDKARLAGEPHGVALVVGHPGTADVAHRTWRMMMFWTREVPSSSEKGAHNLPTMVMPAPGAVWPAMVMSGSVMSKSPLMTPLTSKTTMRGPAVRSASSRLPGPVALEGGDLDDLPAATTAHLGAEPLDSGEGQHFIGLAAGHALVDSSAAIPTPRRHRFHIDNAR